MLCEHCKIKEATTLVKITVNGKEFAYNLCDDCSRNLGFFPTFSNVPSVIPGNFDELMNQALLLNSVVSKGVNQCSVCGTTFNDIKKSGVLGCANCYKEFSKELAPIILQIQKSSEHIGKKLTEVKKVKDIEKKRKFKNSRIEMEKLKIELKEAIAKENFENAAGLRDKITALEKEGEI